MTPEALKTLIENDAEAMSLASAGDWAACAKRASDIAPPARKVIAAQDIIRAAILDGSWAKIQLASESPEVPIEVRGLCVSFLTWMQHEWSIDVDIAQVKAMISGMVKSGLITEDAAVAIDALANHPQTLSALECRIAMKGQ